MTGGQTRKSTDSGKLTTQEKIADNGQIYMVVDGCKVKLNFPPKSESTAVNDVKRMMLVGLVKT